MREQHALGAIAILIPILTACTFTSDLSADNDDSVYASEINQVIEKAKGTPSEVLVSRILSDSKITEEEIVEVTNQHTQCMKEAGFPDYSYDLSMRAFDYGRVISDEEVEHVDALEAGCNRKTSTSELVSLHYAMRTNPTNMREEDLMAACLVKLQVVDPSYTGKQYLEEFERYRAEHTQTDGTLNSDPRLGLSYTVDVDNGVDAAKKCAWNPQEFLQK